MGLRVKREIKLPHANGAEVATVDPADLLRFRPSHIDHLASNIPLLAFASVATVA